MLKMEAINLDLLPGAMPPIVHVSQGDVGRQFTVSIYDDTGAAYSLTGKTLSIVGHKGDGNVFQYAIPSSAISGNTVTITTEEQMTPAAGKALCEIRIEQGTTKLGTCNFVMDVEQGPADMGSLSISALYMIDALFEQAETDIATASAAATAATQKATEAAASAASAAESLSQIGDAVDVATAKATAAANSASAAATSETNAAASASTASTAATNASNSATSADTSATAAATSASAASTSASNAATYASAADTSADNASDYADAASQSATAAATSADNASASETNAAASESAAATSETNAAASETAAAGSASAAATSATNASDSATAAANSASAAASSASDAEDAKDAIEDMTVSSQSVPYTSSAEVTKSIVQGVVNLDFKIPRGEPTSGHDVEANPSGAATGGDITKLGIDGTIYDISGLPDYSQASQNDVLTLGQSGPEWAPPTGGSSDGVIPVYYTQTAYIGEIYDASGTTKLWDRDTDTEYEFQSGAYKLRLYSSRTKELFNLQGKSMFFNEGHGPYGFYRYFAIPAKYSLDWSTLYNNQYLEGMGSTDFVNLLPSTISWKAGDSNYFVDATGYITTMFVKEAGDAFDTVLNKLMYIIDLDITVQTAFTYTKSDYSVDFSLSAENYGQNYIASASRIIGL